MGEVVASSKVQETLVVKFGGSAVATPAHFSKIAEVVAAQVKGNRRLLVVVSAMGGMTDELIALAHEINPDPPQREQDMLISVGERISVSLLAMALAKIDIEAVSFTGSQSGIITTDCHSNAHILNVRPHRLMNALNADKIAIVAGFQGVSESGEITTLGRGGSDTTAVALAVALGASQVEFYKDVRGVYHQDPKVNGNALFYSTLSYEQAVALIDEEGGVLHPRCLFLAQKNGIALHVRSFLNLEAPGTLISDFSPGSATRQYEKEQLLADALKEG